MATVRDAKQTQYLAGLYAELEGMKARVGAMRKEFTTSEGIESPVFAVHDRHLLELEEYIGWKLEILAKATPFEWNVAGDKVESIVSVRAPERVTGPDFSGGYIGG